MKKAQNVNATVNISRVAKPDVISGVYRSFQPAAPHPRAARRRAQPRLSRVRQDLRHLLRPQAAHAHTLQRQAIPVQSLL